jgi:hypothetical protein
MRRGIFVFSTLIGFQKKPGQYSVMVQVAIIPGLAPVPNIPYLNAAA